MKKIVIVACMLCMALAAGLYIGQSENEVALPDLAKDNMEALAKRQINPECPNGCIDDSGGCYCNGSHPQYKEYGGW
ncbi:MAG: NVEALA domain-containing protein [Tannerellaceae bacterium]|jgi:hypothetical protein|nr:NVEALA domain-containing protein [Tannerellaceae bacterium]